MPQSSIFIDEKAKGNHFSKGTQVLLKLALKTPPTKERQHFAAKKIQGWYRKKLAERIMNLKIKDSAKEALWKQITERSIHVDEFVKHRNDLEKLLEFKDADHQAIAAFYQNKLNEAEVNTILEAKQILRVHGENALETFPLFEPGKNYFSLNTAYLVNLLLEQTTWFCSKESYSAQQKLRIIFALQQKLIHRPEITKHIYKIKLKWDSLKGTKIWYEGNVLSILPLRDSKKITEDHYIVLPHSVVHVLGEILFGTNWFTHKIRLGTLSNTEIDKAQRRKIRPVSVSTHSIALPKKSHKTATDEDAIKIHDDVHGFICSAIPEEIGLAFNYLIDIVRQETQLEWTKELFHLMDRGILPWEIKLTQDNAKDFCTILNGVLLDKFDKSSTRPFVWFMIMNMVDNLPTWQVQFNIDIDKLPDFKKEISFYKENRYKPTFPKDTASKINWLEKNGRNYNPARFQFAKDRKNHLTVAEEVKLANDSVKLIKNYF